MKKLNRKEYKNTIKEFRKDNPIAQVSHQWVYAKDMYGYEWIIFVHGSIIKRHKNKTKYSPAYFNYNNYNFSVILYGDKSIHFSLYDGIHIKRIYSSVEVFNNNEFKVLTLPEVKELYDKFFNVGKEFYKHIFVNNSINNFNI